MFCTFQAKRPYPFDDLPAGCQFSVPDHDLIPVDGVDWCPFHCPMTDKAGKLTGKEAAWDTNFLTDKLRRFTQEAKDNNRTADFTGVIFPADINFGEMELPAICFYQAIFSGNAGFQEATFSGIAGFQEATFSGNAEFQEATFNGIAGFQEATFSGNAEFQEATFSGNAPGFRR